jgi:hypothetical protein
LAAVRNPRLLLAARELHDLCHEAAVVPHQAGQANPAEPRAGPIESGRPSRLVECAGSRVLHDVIKKPPRAGRRAVLVINQAVYMPDVGGRDQ